ncbi:SDR family NAD(P)-dependent oxidoreductase [Brachybacterium huguangmaarense]
MHRALITGGTSGIGAAFARAFARRGVDLVLVARDEERLRETAADLRREHGIDVETIRADLADRDDQARVARRLEADGSDPDLPIVDVLVNNAGFSLRTSLLDPDPSTHDRAHEVMVRSVIVLCSAAARAMSARGQGWIINVGSVSAFVPQNNYSAIKAWMNAYTEALHVQLAGTGVSATLLAPGWVRTEFHARAGITGSSIPGFLWLSSDRLVEDCLRDVARGKAVSIPSLRFKVITTAMRIAPRGLVHGISAALSARRNRER